jgi:hypothetical protein
MLSANLKFLIDRRGMVMTLRKPLYGAYSPATGTLATTSSTDYTVKGYFSSYTLSELDNDSLVLGDRQLVLSNVDTSGVTLPEPDAEDKVIAVGDDVLIKAVQKIYNADTLVCYICQVRG